ncbi:fimbrial protein [Pseudomonas sp. 25 R 14]|uniref:fimbrial protein n=1 Tax=Pseudomonas sp. 25 R 14 TaxID=1844109 RepID=UPI00111226A4|nr:fimbrial protein [Pseudomonas sp. 25 R 14]
MTIRRDIAIGTEIGSTVVTTSINAFSCTGTFSYQEFGVKGYGTASSKINGLNIYKLGSGASGIGYALYGNSGTTCPSYSPIDGSTFTGNINDKIFCSVNGLFGEQPMKGSLKLVFYKIGEVTPGKIPGQEVASFILRNNQNSWQRPESYFTTTAFTVNTLGCSVDGTNIDVSLGEVGMKELGSAGITAAERQFSIPLSCDRGTKVKLTLKAGNASIYDNVKGLLNLTNPTSADTAQGVKVQILSNDAPVKYEEPLDIGTQTGQGTFNIPLQARYYRIADSLKAGTANSSVIYTITYE